MIQTKIHIKKIIQSFITAILLGKKKEFIFWLVQIIQRTQFNVPGNCTLKNTGWQLAWGKSSCDIRDYYLLQELHFVLNKKENACGKEWKKHSAVLRKKNLRNQESYMCTEDLKRCTNKTNALVEERKS